MFAAFLLGRDDLVILTATRGQNLGEGQTTFIVRNELGSSDLPKVITGNLNAPVMMIAEKLADRIRGVQPLPPSTAPFYRS